MAVHVPDGGGDSAPRGDGEERRGCRGTLVRATDVPSALRGSSDEPGCRTVTDSVDSEKGDPPWALPRPHDGLRRRSDVLHCPRAARRGEGRAPRRGSPSFSWSTPPGNRSRGRRSTPWTGRASCPRASRGTTARSSFAASRVRRRWERRQRVGCARCGPASGGTRSPSRSPLGRRVPRRGPSSGARSASATCPKASWRSERGTSRLRTS